MKPILVILLVILKLGAATDEFFFSGFSDANLTIDGVASITSNGLLELTNTTKQMKGHAFYPEPLHFKTSPASTKSFSTTFVFGIISEIADLGGHGIAFVLSPTKDLSTSLPSQYLGLFNGSNNGNASNHIIAVELDTIQSSEFKDIDNNHVGIDINSLQSNVSHHAGYYTNSSKGFQNLILISGQPMQVWIEYDSLSMWFNVTLGAVNMPKPQWPLLSLIVNLSSIIQDPMYAGFSSSTGSVHTSHYVLGWSFKMNGKALTFSELPRLPKKGDGGRSSKALSISLPLAAAILLLLVAGAVIYVQKRKVMFAELLEDWEKEYGPHRFSYRNLFAATKGFREKELLGTGGFGRVYRGVLPTTKLEIAVKRVSHESRQGMREFVAEIVSIGQLRHRNLVQLLGYCRRKGELLLVYDFMPNGSLDKFLYDATKPALDWAQRFRIIKGVASGLLYLHEDWEKVVIHRDIKASNVLLDSEMNARLGDFGLARLYDHGSDPQTTHIVGTMGYLAPELARTGKATPFTDVFAFGAFVLEVACGRRPVEPMEDEVVLVDWVLENWKRGAILDSRDPRLGNQYVDSELELVMRVGLLCSHPLPAMRPTMRNVMKYLDHDMPVPELSPKSSFSSLTLLQNDGFDEYVIAYPSSSFSTVALSSAGFSVGGR